MLGFDPIQIEMVDAPGETMMTESRVNYSKLMTIEHNCMVSFIGRVTPKDFKEIVLPAVNSCWNAKNQDPMSGHQHSLSYSSRGSIEG